MSGLDHRGSCRSGECTCGGFLTISYELVSNAPRHSSYRLHSRQEPTHPSDVCICRHAWWQHTIVVPNPFSRSRGGLGTCGAFYPVRYNFYLVRHSASYSMLEKQCSSV